MDGPVRKTKEHFTFTSMNLDTVLIENGIDVRSIKQMLAEKNYKKLYSSFQDAIECMCFVTSENEFDDFISDHGEIDEEAFLLALAAARSLCSCYGVNEEEEMKEYLEGLDCEYSVLFSDCYDEGTYYIFLQ